MEISIAIPFLLGILFVEVHSWGQTLPEAVLPTPDLLKYWGYPFETHEAATEDGYVLTLHRILPRKNTTSKRWTGENNAVFYLQHPFISASHDWILNLPHQSIGYTLADQGADVWMSNVRGNTYSKKHVKYPVDSKLFWDFSFDEYARYDFPASVNYILNITGKQKLYYVGYSQGSMMAFARLSEDMDLQSKIKMFFAVTPVTRMTHASSMTRLARFSDKFEWLCRIFGIREFLATEKSSKIAAARFCGWVPWLCGSMISSVMGFEDLDHVNMTRFPVYFGHMPSGTSSKNVLQFLQMAKSNRFQKFDYGRTGNLIMYNTSVPPEYNISNIHIPVVLMSGSADLLSNRPDVEWTYKQLPNVVKWFEIKGYSHAGFAWATNAKEEVTDRIVRLIRVWSKEKSE